MRILIYHNIMEPSHIYLCFPVLDAQKTVLVFCFKQLVFADRLYFFTISQYQHHMSQLDKRTRLPGESRSDVNDPVSIPSRSTKGPRRVQDQKPSSLAVYQKTIQVKAIPGANSLPRDQSFDDRMKIEIASAKELPCQSPQYFKQLYGRPCKAEEPIVFVRLDFTAMRIPMALKLVGGGKQDGPLLSEEISNILAVNENLNFSIMFSWRMASEFPLKKASKATIITTTGRSMESESWGAV